MAVWIQIKIAWCMEWVTDWIDAERKAQDRAKQKMQICLMSVIL